MRCACAANLCKICLHCQLECDAAWCGDGIGVGTHPYNEEEDSQPKRRHQKKAPIDGIRWGEANWDLSRTFLGRGAASASRHAADCSHHVWAGIHMPLVSTRVVKTLRLSRPSPHCGSDACAEACVCPPRKLNSALGSHRAFLGCLPIEPR